MKNFLLLYFLFLLLSACGKKTTVKGRVYNPVTGEGIPGITILVTKDKFGLGYDGNGVKKLYSTTTDANGNFVIEERFRKSKAYKLNYIFDLDSYSLIQGEAEIIGPESDGIEFQYPLIPKGKLIRNLTNINCFDSNDLLVITQYYRPFPNLYGTPTAVHYEGCYSHQGSTNSVPMGWYVWVGTVTKNGISTPFADSIYVTEGGNHVWNINY